DVTAPCCSFTKEPSHRGPVETLIRIGLIRRDCLGVMLREDFIECHLGWVEEPSVALSDKSDAEITLRSRGAGRANPVSALNILDSHGTEAVDNPVRANRTLSEVGAQRSNHIPINQTHHVLVEKWRMMSSVPALVAVARKGAIAIVRP